MKSRKSAVISDRTVTRRGLLEWLGRGCVLALSGSALAACGGDAKADGGWEQPNGSSSGGFPFEPGSDDHPIYKNWGERTVDRQDLSQILKNWRLRVDGMVESPGVYTFADLVELPRSDMVVDFHCVEGWSVFDVPWNGVHLSEIFERVQPKKGATHVTFHTIGGKYNGSLPLEVALEPKIILAYGIAGSTLPLKRGFPVRIVIPRLLAYKSSKYVERIELTDRPVPGFWVAYGYPYDGEVPQSRLRPGKY